MIARAALAVATLALFVSPYAWAQCKPSDIDIDKVRGRVDGDYVYVAGRLVNNCASATGVQIKITVYNKAGDILTVRDLWPASINNIPPRSDFPFEIMVPRQAGFANFDTRVIGTRVWPPR